MLFPDTGRGLGCTRQVDEGEEIIVVPLDSCWWEGSSREAAEIKPLIVAGVSFTALDVTALHVLLERSKGQESSRWSHIEVLPPDYDSTLFWNDAELSELCGSAWHGLAEMFTEEAWADWERLRTMLAATEASQTFLQRHSITWEDYLWAYATLKSRQAEVTVDGEKTRLMAPGFDLFNHSDALVAGSTHFFDPERRALVARASHRHEKGEQAFISYGMASNGSLLLGGGFVLTSNRCHDHLRLHPLSCARTNLV